MNAKATYSAKVQQQKLIDRLVKQRNQLDKRIDQEKEKYFAGKY